MILLRFFFTTTHQTNPMTVITSAMTKKNPDRTIPPTNRPFILVGLLTELVGELVAIVVKKELRTNSSSISISKPSQYCIKQALLKIIEMTNSPKVSTEMLS